MLDSGSAPGAVGERGEVDGDGPALGPLDEPGRLVRGRRRAQVGEEDRRVERIERQLRRAHLDQAPADAQPSERQRDGRAAAQHDGRPGWHLGDEHRQHVQDVAAGQLVDVVEHEHERARRSAIMAPNCWSASRADGR